MRPQVPRQHSSSKAHLKVASLPIVVFVVNLLWITTGFAQVVRLQSFDLSGAGVARNVDQLGIGNYDVQIEQIIFSTAPPARILPPDDGIKRSNDKTIYGMDDRRDFFQIPNLEVKRIALAVGSISLLGERNVPARGFCTAFLIAKNMAMTASHCINYNDYKMKVIRFNDQFLAPGFPDEIDSYEIEWLETWDRSHDFAILKIKPNSSGNFPGDKYPIVKLQKTSAAKGTPLYLIGHPDREYKKYVPNCSVVVPPYFHPDGKYTFGTDCDAFGGNSGSPVFDARTHKVVGVLWGGQKDVRVIPVGDAVNHEFVVPMWKIAEATQFDVGHWPADVTFVARPRAGSTVSRLGSEVPFAVVAGGRSGYESTVRK